MEALKNGSEDFVTVVSVGNQLKVENFVTVLSIGNGESGKGEHFNIMNNGDTHLDEEVEVYRLPGERLGFGLKFEGGNKTSETVRRLFVQSCAEQSPASRAKCSWGGLGEGDEILCIDGVPVKHMSRLDCVRRLKESQLVIKLLVRYRGALKPEVVSAERKSVGEKTKIPPELPSVPPPVPPRKLRQARGSADGSEANPSPTKKISIDQNSSNEMSASNAQPNLRTTSTDNKCITRDNYNSSSNSINNNIKNESTRRLPKEPSVEAIKLKEPPEAMVYLDARSQDGSSTHGSTSDDTGSSLSTVVDRFSTTSTSDQAFASDESVKSDRQETDHQADNGGNVDRSRETSQEIFESFEQLDRDFCLNPPDYLLKRLANSLAVTHVESRGEAGAVVEKITAVVAPNTVVIEETLTLQPPLSFQDAPLSHGHEARPEVFFTADLAADSSTHFRPIQDDISIVESINCDCESDNNINIPPPLPARNHINCIPINQNDVNKVDIKFKNSEEDKNNCDDKNNCAPILPPKPLPRKDSKLKRKRLPPPPPPPTPRRQQLPPPIPIRNLELKRDEGSESKTSDDVVTVVEISTNLLQESKDPSEITSSFQDKKLPTVAFENKESIESSSRSFDNHQKQMNGINTNEESLINGDCDKSKSREIIIDNYKETNNKELFKSKTTTTNTNKVLEIIEMKKVKAFNESTAKKNAKNAAEKNSDKVENNCGLEESHKIKKSGVIKDTEIDDNLKVPASNINCGKLSKNKFDAERGEEEEEEEEEYEEARVSGRDDDGIEELVTSFDHWEEAREYQDDDMETNELQIKPANIDDDEDDEELYQSLDSILDDNDGGDEDEDDDDDDDHVDFKKKFNSSDCSKGRQQEESDSSSDSDDTGNEYYWQSNLATIGEEEEVPSLEYTSVNKDINEITKNSSKDVNQSSAKLSTAEEIDGINNNDVQDEIECMSRISKDPETTDKKADKNTVNGRMDNCGGGQRLPPDGDEFPAAYQEFSSVITSQQQKVTYQVLETSRNGSTITTSDNENEGGYSYKKSSNTKNTNNNNNNNNNNNSATMTTTSFQSESRISQYIIPSVKEMTITSTTTSKSSSGEIVQETSPEIERRNFNKSNAYHLNNFNNRSNSNAMVVLTEKKIEIGDYCAKESSEMPIDNTEKDCPPPPLPLTEPPKIEKPVPLGRSMSTDNSSRKFSFNSAASGGIGTGGGGGGIGGIGVDSRRQDDKSEKSVRDKIAMFSSQSNLEAPLFPSNPITTTVSVVTNFNRRLSKYKSTEDFFGEEKSCCTNQKDKRPFNERTFSSSTDLTESIINKSNFVYDKYVDRPPILPQSGPPEDVGNKGNYSLRNSTQTKFTSDVKATGNGVKIITSIAATSTSPNNTLSTSDKKEDGGVSVTKTPTMSLTRATSFSGGVCTSSSSSSSSCSSSSSNGELSPINNGQISRANSLASTFKRTSEDMRRTSLNQLIEQRRKSISKLRGLVIPEKDAVSVDKPIIDLPEIKSRDSILNQQMPKVNIQDKWGSQSSLASNISTSSVPVVKTTSFKMPAPQSLPKYSPAFKRKSLTVCGTNTNNNNTTTTTTTSSNNNNNNNTNNNSHITNPSNPSTPSTQQTTSPTPASTSIPTEAPKSLESICSPTRSDYSFEFVPSSSSPENLRTRPRISQRKPRGDYDDSDNDSAVSSSQSSISRGFSPPTSPVPSERSNVSSDRSYPMSLITEIPSRNYLLTERSQFTSKPLLYSSEKYCASNRSFSDSSSGNSNPRSPPSEYNPRYSSIPQRQPLKRSSSTETNYSTSSTLTSGSQASAESLSRRVLKPQSVEAINRKNILASARCRSGQNLNGSPLIQRKFSDDEETNEKTSPLSYDRVVDDLSTNGDIKVAYVDMIDNFETIKDDNPEDDLQSSSKPSQTKPNDTLMPSNDLKMWVQAEAKALLEKNSSQSVNNNIFHSDSDDKQPNGDEHHPKNQSQSSSIVNESMINGNSFNEDVESEGIKSIEAQNDHLLATLTTKTRSRAPINFDDGAIIRNKHQLSLEDILTGKVDHQQTSRNSESNQAVYNNSRGKATGENNSSYREAKISREDCSPDEQKPFVSKIPTYGRLKSEDNSVGIIQERSRNSKIPLQKPLNRRSASVTDIKKATEQKDYPVNNNNNVSNGNESSRNNVHYRFSSLDSSVKERRHVNGENDGDKYYAEQFGSISSLASSTSLISQQELAQLVEEASLDDSRGMHEIVVVLLHKDNPTGSVGITLAGGVDCEAKEITVHRVLAHSIADKDGRVLRGDRILSINGKSTRGLNHRESLAILKQPRSEVVLVVSRPRTEDSRSFKMRAESVETIVEGTTVNGTEDTAWGPPTRVVIYKGGAGLGFSLEGGRDSPIGDKPLVIKKIFTGGAAEKTGALTAGDQLLEVNGTDVTRMSRIEAWSLMKKLHNGEVNLLVRHPAIKSS